MTASRAGRVCVVTVTYADRFHLLEQVVEAATREGADQVVIVDNASAPASTARVSSLAAASGGRILCVRHETNLGSAGGYKAGLMHALRSTECDFVWLLDDDNRPEPGALSSLLDAYERLASIAPSDRLGLLSLRPDRAPLEAIARGRDYKEVFPRRSSFLGFHVLDLPRKLVRLLRGAAVPEPSKSYTGVARLPFGPYGGLFLHRTAVERMGYPNENFFVYADDTEYTYRLTRRGGNLFLVPASLVTDLESSWWVKGSGHHLLPRLLGIGSDLQIYYSIRNKVHFDLYYWALNRLTFELNKWIFMALLFAFAIWWRKWDRLALIIRAVRDGESGRLGVDAVVGTSPDQDRRV